MRRTSTAVFALTALLGFTGAAPAPSDALELRIHKKAVLVDDGRAVTLRVTASCPPGADLLESFVYVNQDGFSTQFGSFDVPCDGTRHETTVTATALDPVLEAGKASASGYMLLTTGESISPSQRIKLR